MRVLKFETDGTETFVETAYNRIGVGGSDITGLYTGTADEITEQQVLTWYYEAKNDPQPGRRVQTVITQKLMY